MNLLRNFCQNMLNYIYPPKCAFCGAVGAAESPCAHCKAEVELLRQKGKAEAEAFSFPFLDGLLFYASYEGLVRSGVHRFKFGGAYTLAQPYAALLAGCGYVFDPDGVMAPVPSFPKALKERGFDAAFLLCKSLGERLSIPVLRALQKDYDTPPQHSLSRRRRTANLIGVYSIPHPEEIRGKTVYLIDDVCTTGSTLNECAKTLKIFGAKQVFGICFAATPAKGPNGKGEQDGHQ